MGTTKKNKGVGDVIQSITSAIGIEPCEGCQSRKDRLNILFPFGTPKQMTTEQRLAYQDNIESPEVLLAIYNELFDTDLQSTQDNVLNMVKNKLELIYGQE